MSRCVYLLGVGLALVAAGLAFTDWALSLRPGVTERNVQRVRQGMTVWEVEALLGGPGKFVGGGGSVFERSHPGEPLGRGGMFEMSRWERYLWAGPDGVASVRFALDSSLKPRSVSEVTFRRTAGPGLLARLRAWLGW